MPAARRGAITGASSDNSSGNFSNITNSSGLSSRSSSSSLFGVDASANPNFNGNSNLGMSGFNFGATTNTPAAATGFSMSPATPSAPSFGSTAAPSTGAFTFNTPGPAPSSGIFGATPAPSTGAFGAPAAPTMGAFGAPNQSPAQGGFAFNSPSTGGAFGAAPAGTSLFGGAPAPAQTFGAFGGSSFGAPAPQTSLFGAPQLATAAPGTPQQSNEPTFTGQAHYVTLPKQQQQAIDTLYNQIMQHKRSMVSVASLHPRLLEKQSQQADAAAGEEMPLPVTMKNLSADSKKLNTQVRMMSDRTRVAKVEVEKTCKQCHEYALWPIQFVASRMGVKRVQPPEPSTEEEKKEMDQENEKLRRLFDDFTTYTVDQVERMPSAYLWELLHEMERRAVDLNGRVLGLKRTMATRKSITPKDQNVVSIVRLQDDRIWKIGNSIGHANMKVENLRRLYNAVERGLNVLQEQKRMEIEYNRSVNQEISVMNIIHLKQGEPAQAPASIGGFAPAPSGFGAAPSPSTGFSFGSASTPAPSGLFGSTPSPAPAGSLFGAPTSTFGATPTAGAPAPPAGIFGTPSTGSLFGNSTPAPATGSFSAPSTPAPTFGQPPVGAPAAFPSFGAQTPAPLFNAASSTPKSKNKSSGRGTRRKG